MPSNTAKGLRGRALPGPDGYEQIPELAERGRQRVVAFLQRLDQQLQRCQFVAGDQFTIADMTAMVLVDFAAWSRIELPAGAEYERLRPIIEKALTKDREERFQSSAEFAAVLTACLGDSGAVSAAGTGGRSPLSAPPPFPTSQPPRVPLTSAARGLNTANTPPSRL